MPKVLFYVSGHGFGHAVRSAEVMRQLLARRHDLMIHIRTTAPKIAFDGLPQERVRLERASIDSGVVERGPLRVDVTGTLVALRQLWERREEIVREESTYVRQTDIQLIVADVPYLAGAVAKAACRPCVAIGNFTWDWIYEPYLDGTPSRELGDFAANGYSDMDKFFRLPFGHPMRNIRCVVDVPLVARRSKRAPEKMRNHLGISADARPVVLIGMRGALEEETLVRVADQNRDMLFLHLQAPISQPKENLRGVDLGPSLSFPDLLRVSDVVVCKLGYGIVADIIANATRLLWPARSDFREDEILAPETPKYIPAREIPLADFASGAWGDHLRELLTASKPETTIATNGSDVVAGHLLDMLRI